MPSSCVFEFDRPEPVYYSGETINGRVQLHTTTEKNVREANIVLEGAAKVHWDVTKTREENGKTHSYTVSYHGSEMYFYAKTKVFNGGTLPPGNHTYTFSIQIPLNCPTSCVEVYGKIYYELSLILDRPRRFDNIFKQPLTVIKELNLNQIPELLVPLHSEDVKYFCCWPCSSGPVLSTLTIPFGGYAPGQKIKYTLEIDNQSHGYDLTDGIELKLQQVYSFEARTPHPDTRSVTNTLARAEQSIRCLRFSKRIIEGTLLIPPVPPSSQDGRIICVSYYILMTIDTGACHASVDITLPITIGTIPLEQSATVEWTPNTPDTPDTPDDKPPSYDQLKPPSFEEATHMSGKFIDTDVDEHNRTDGFIPKYPMFTNFAVPSAPPAPDDSETTTVPYLQSPPAEASAPATSEQRTYGWSS